MNDQSLKNFLSAIFETIIKAIGGVFVAHGLVPKETAVALLGYSNPLADYTLGLIIVVSGHIITFLKSEKAQNEIDHLKHILSIRLQQIGSNLDHVIEAKINQINPPIPILQTAQVQSQPTNPK